MNKQIRTKKFICEVPIFSSKLTSIYKWISAHKTNKFMVLVQIVNIAEEFYAKLCKICMTELDKQSTIMHLAYFIKLYMIKLMQFLRHITLHPYV